MAKRQRDGRETAGPAQARVLVGAVTGAHGIKGEVKLRSFTDKPEDIAAYGPLYDEAGKRFDIRVRACTKGGLIAAVAGVSDRNAAESLRGTKLYVPRAALPALDAGEFYYSDLIGLRAERADGSEIGVVTGVANFGAGDVIEIAGKKTLDLPFTSEIVREVDIVGGRIVIALPEESEARAPAAKPARAARRGRARGK